MTGVFWGLHWCRYLMPTFEPYGGTGWWAACILPPSAVSLFATILMRLESNGRGVRWNSINAVITNQGEFSAASVFIMLTVDVFFYGILTWYLDKVRALHCMSSPLTFHLSPSTFYLGRLTFHHFTSIDLIAGTVKNAPC